MKSDWQPMLFNFVAYKSTNLHILASFEDIEALLGDHLVKTATMKNSPLIAIFQKDVNQWDSELVSCLASCLTDPIRLIMLTVCVTCRFEAQDERHFGKLGQGPVGLDVLGIDIRIRGHMQSNAKRKQSI